MPNYKIIPTQNFLDEASQLLKKYPNIKKNFLDLARELKSDPVTVHDRLVDDCYKVRMQITDKGGGKSGGAHVIVNVQVVDKVVYVISVFDKGKFSTIADFALKRLLKIVLPSKYKK